MGVLDPDTGSSKWSKALIKFHSAFCYVLCVTAFVWFALLPYRHLTTASYFSENALLPGLVTSDFKNPKIAAKFYDEYLEEIKNEYSTSDKMPVGWLVSKMSQVNLEVHTHNFTLNYPLGHSQKFTGVNVFGILRAPRTASVEALVLSAPYRPLSSPQKGTAAGIALMLAFAKFARSQKYWAKDIIFLVTEHEQLGVQAWLEAYHGVASRSATYKSTLGSLLAETEDLDADLQTKWLDAGKLTGRSGSILAAINLELHTPAIKFVEIKVEGLNGQLPNLDLVNLVHKMCNQIHHSFKYSYSWYAPRGAWLDWKNNFKTMFGMMTTQIAGVPNGNHGLFHRFGIEAVTLEGCEAEDPIKGTVFRASSLPSANFGRLGIVIESTFRSLNNLLERFHQSYFFYLRPCASRFVSIGQYIPPLGLLVGALFIKAYAMWLRLEKSSELFSSKFSDTENENNASDEKSGEEELKETATSKLPDDASEDHKDTVDDQHGDRYSLLNVGIVFIAVHLIGYLVMISPLTISTIGENYFLFPTSESLFYGFAALSVVLAICLPAFLHYSITADELEILYILALVELATTLLSVGMHNFSLGFCLAAAYTPFVLSLQTRSKDSRWGYFKKTLLRIFFIMLHPLMLTTLTVMVYTNFVFTGETVPSLLMKGIQASQQALTFSVVDGMIYGNWLFSVVTLVLFPTWTIFWQVLHIKPSSQ